MNHLTNFFSLLISVTPDRLRFIYGPAQILLYLRIKVWSLSGLECNTKEELAILFAGKEIDMNYFVKLGFDSHCNVKYLGKAWFFQIPKMARRKNYFHSLYVVETPNFFNIKNCFRIPCWIYEEVDVSADLNSIIRKNHTLRSTKKIIKKYALSYEVTEDSVRLHDFYHDMLVPYTNKRYPNSDMIEKYELLKKKFRKCDLLLLKWQGQEIAGGLIGYNGTKVHFLYLGIKDAKPAYIEIGALGAIYYFTLQYLNDKGFKKVDLGLSRAFLRDGVLNYKRKWGSRITSPTKVFFLLKQLQITGGTKGFLENNPFIYMDKRQFYCAVFINENTKINQDMAENIAKKYSYPGISKINIFNLGSESPAYSAENGHM